MTYRVSRSRECQTDEASAESPEARAAIRILRTWANAYPRHHLVIRDETGAPVAFRRPAAMTAVANQPLFLV